MDHIDSVLASLDLFSDLAENLVSPQPPFPSAKGRFLAHTLPCTPRADCIHLCS